MQAFSPGRVFLWLFVLILFLLFLKKKWHNICCFSDIEMKFSGHVAFYIPSSSEEKSEYMVLQNCGYIGITEKYCKGIRFHVSATWD